MKIRNLIIYSLEFRLFHEFKRKIFDFFHKNDDDYLTKRFKVSLGYKPSLENPTSFNEKLLWSKLNWRNGLAKKCSDKLAMKEYLDRCNLSEYYPKTLKVYDTENEFLNDTKNLPDSCVIKTNHDSGSVFVKTKFTSKRKLNKGIRKIVNGFQLGSYSKLSEWVYEGIDKKIFIEEKLGNNKDEIKDYKFFCFNGEPYCLFVGSKRNTLRVRFDYFDLDWNWLNVKNVHYHERKHPLKPDNFNKMVEICKIVSKPFPHVRVDMYSIHGKIYIGELTFFHYAGDEKFKPRSFDYVLGSKWNLPLNSNDNNI